MQLTDSFWDHVITRKDSQEEKRIYRWLNDDNLGGIFLDDFGQVFWIECNPGGTLPQFVYSYIKRWAKSLGYKYAYDLK